MNIFQDEPHKHFRMSSSAKKHEYLLCLCIKIEEDQLTLKDWLKVLPGHLEMRPTAVFPGQ